MRINMHDFSGHPFQVQLSRELARRGHEVVHEYSHQYVTGHGRLEVSSADPATLTIRSVQTDLPYRKYELLGRGRFELNYARAWQQNLRRNSYDVVVACNVPLFTLAKMRRYFGRTAIPWVLWHQDVYSLGVAAEAHRRLPRYLSSIVGGWLQRLEAKQVNTADAVVAIGPGFVEQYRLWNLDPSHVSVVPNWAPLDEVVPADRNNSWARGHGLREDAIRLLYAGTLGRKHNPLLLLDILDATRAQGVRAALTVVSEGIGADELRRASHGRQDVRILGYQPAERLGEVLASADVLLALLEPDAARFSIPSKIFTYFAAGRPTVALVPDGNPCVEDVRAAGGHVSPPTKAGAEAAARWITQHREASTLKRLGHQARALAEERFDIRRIGDTFESILCGVARADALEVTGSAR